MSKELLRATLDRVQSLSEGESCDLSVEQAGVLRAFLQARGAAASLSDGERKLHEHIAGLLAAWKPDGAGQPTSGQEQRTQFTLRAAVEKGQQQAWETLAQEELELVFGTLEALQDQIDSRSARLKGILTEIVVGYQAYVEQTGAQAKPMGSSLSEVTIAEPPKKKCNAAEMFQGVAAAPLAFLEGIKVDLNARVLKEQQGVELNGNVPSDAVLIVEEGGATINGMVTGHVAAKGNIEIKGNVQGGWVVSTHGNVTLEGALLGAKVVSMRGDVTATRIEGAERVFAWNRLVVAETILSGTVYGTQIEIAERASGAELHALGTIKAKCIETSSRSPSTICLRKDLSSDDYNRRPEDELGKTRRELPGLDSKIENANRMMGYRLLLTRGCSRTSLFYLIGGVESGASATQFQDLQDQTLHLAQIVDIGHDFLRFYKQDVPHMEKIDKESAASHTRESSKALKFVIQHIEALPNEFGARGKGILLQTIQALEARVKAMNETVANRPQLTQECTKFDRFLSETRELQRKTKRQLDDLLIKFEVDPAIIRRMDVDPDSVDGILANKLAEAERNPRSEMAHRAASPVIRLLEKTSEMNKRGIEAWDEEAKSSTEKREQILDKLEKEAVLKLGARAVDACSVSADSFDAGTIITSSPRLRHGQDCKVGEVIVLGDKVASWTTFQLQDRVIHRLD